jgi:hypothetical protein
VAKNKERQREYDRARYQANRTEFIAQRRAYYQKNKKKILERTLIWTKKRMASNRDLVNAAKANPCKDCGGIFPFCVMDFDHRPGTKKIGSISSLVGNWIISAKKLIIEMEKCDLVCANCHRIRTYNRLPNHR